MKKPYYFLKRCSDLSKYAIGNVSPNPMVGALIVHNQSIIGEGFHKHFGSAHAEVNAIDSVNITDKSLIPESDLYISLEPCNFFGKTPPCTELILKHNIKNIFVSNLDRTSGIDGQSLLYLQKNQVSVRLLQCEIPQYNPVRFRNVYAAHKRPYIVIKYASSLDGFIGRSNERIKLSNSLSDRWVHLLRSYCDGILIGKNTALSDQPQLTTRLVPGKSPVKILIDTRLDIPPENGFFNSPGKKLVYNFMKDEQNGEVHFIKLTDNDDFLSQLLTDLYHKNIGILLIEGGSYTISKFLEKELFDEIYEIRTRKVLKTGIPKPKNITDLKQEFQFRDDIVLRKYVQRDRLC